MSSGEKPVIEFEPVTLADIFLATYLCDVEISGFARVERDGRKFRVYGEAIIFDQTCHGSRTDPDQDAMCRWYDQIRSSGDLEKIEDADRQKMWWHSHVRYSTEFSGQDWATMRTLLSHFDEWWLVLVVNKLNDYCLALIEKNDGHISYEETAIRLNPAMTDAQFADLMERRKSIIQTLVRKNVTIVSEDVGL